MYQLGPYGCDVPDSLEWSGMRATSHTLPRAQWLLFLEPGFTGALSLFPFFAPMHGQRRHPRRTEASCLFPIGDVPPTCRELPLHRRPAWLHRQRHRERRELAVTPSKRRGRR